MKKIYRLSDPSVKEKVQLMGRYEELADGVTFDWTDSAIKMKAVCAGHIELCLRFEQTAEKQTTEKLANQYFSVYVDDTYQELVFHGVKDGDTITLGFTISGEPEEHEIWVVRQKEREYGSAVLTTVALEGELLCMEKKPALLEFIGDSVTCAGASSKEHDENGTRSYAFLTAKTLGADWRLVCNSGFGLQYDSGGLSGPDAVWVEAYGYENRFRAPEHMYRCHRPADVVCIYLGCNDYHSCRQGTSHFTKEAFAESGKKLIAEIRKYQPDARFVWLYGGISYAAKEAATLCMEELGGEAAGYYTADLGGEYHGGTCWHPSEEEHAMMAEKLIAWFQQKRLL